MLSTWVIGASFCSEHLYQPPYVSAGFREHHRKGGGKNLRAKGRRMAVKCCLLDRTWLWCSWTQSSSGYIRSNQNSTIEQEVLVRILLLLKSYCNWYWLGRRNHFFREIIERFPTLQWMVPHPGAYGQYKLDLVSRRRRGRGGRRKRKRGVSSGVGEGYGMGEVRDGKWGLLW